MMMKLFLIALCFGVSIATEKVKPIDQLCNEFDKLAICKLRETVSDVFDEMFVFYTRLLMAPNLKQGSADDLSVRYHEILKNEYDSAAIENSGAENEAIEMNKRKSAFVRFGKRSDLSNAKTGNSVFMASLYPSPNAAPDAGEVAKRKSSYVRFG